MRPKIAPKAPTDEPAAASAEPDRCGRCPARRGQPLAKDGYVILPTGFGVVSRLDTKTGKLPWQKEFDRGFWSSPVLADGRVYLIDSHGGMQVFRLGDAFELLGAPGIGEAAYATPAIVGERIYIRGLTHLICVAAPPT